MPTDDDLPFLLGDTVLRHVITVFDNKNKRIGLARKQSRQKTSASGLELSETLEVPNYANHWYPNNWGNWAVWTALVAVGGFFPPRYGSSCRENSVVFVALVVNVMKMKGVVVRTHGRVVVLRT